jgi:hypothetical protein
MTPQSIAKKKLTLYVLLALGFAGLIGAHEWAVAFPSAGAASTTPLFFAALGTLSFIAAGLLARRLMKEGSPK